MAGRRQAKVYIEPMLSDDEERSKRLAQLAKSDPGWDAAMMKLTNDVVTSGYYTRAMNPDIDAVSAAQNAYMQAHGGIRGAHGRARRR